MMRRVDPNLYTEHYYLTSCEGFHEWRKSAGKELSGRLERILFHLRVRKTDTILDIGCGRGELLYHLAPRARQIIGVDYSKAAIELSLRTISQLPPPVRRRIRLFLADINDVLPTLTERLNIVLAIDIIEHMYKGQLKLMWMHIDRLLRPGGIIVIHTQFQSPKILRKPDPKKRDLVFYLSVMHVNIHNSIHQVLRMLPGDYVIEYEDNNSLCFLKKL